MVSIQHLYVNQWLSNREHLRWIQQGVSTMDPHLSNREHYICILESDPINIQFKYRCSTGVNSWSPSLSNIRQWCELLYFFYYYVLFFCTFCSGPTGIHSKWLYWHAVQIEIPNTEVAKVALWFDSNKLTINVNKTQLNTNDNVIAKKSDSPKWSYLTKWGSATSK